MRLSVVFELLLVFLFLAFASARVIDPTKRAKHVAKGNNKTTSLRQGPPNRYCACTSRMCNCCRDFSLPVVPLKGPGCASIMYVQRDTMMVTMSFGDRVLSNTTISGKSPKPICMALPGGISQFCGRIYGISRKGDQFRACLGLELRALDDIEAALRVSCFKFGPKGVRLESAPPVPAETSGKDPEEDDEEDYDLDDDEDDDLIGFGVDDEDDGASNEDNEVDSDSVDYTGFSVLGEDILGTLFSDDSGSSSSKKKKPSKKTAKPQIVVPKVSTTTRRPILPNRRRSTAKPLLSSLTSVTKRPILNRVTKKPIISSNRPQIIQRPSISITASPQSTIQTPLLLVKPTFVTKNDFDENIKIKVPTTTTETPQTTRWEVTTVQTQGEEKVEMPVEDISQETTPESEEAITFTIPTQKIEAVKNDIKLPQTDLAKVEAVVAIAQQDVTPGVISSSSLTSEEMTKPLEKVTVKYNKVTPTYAPEITSFYTPVNAEKISSIKFIPTTVVTLRPSIELANKDVDNSIDELAEIATTPESETADNNNKNIIDLLTTELTQSGEVNKGNVENSSADKDTALDNIEKNSKIKKGNSTNSLKKQTVKKPQNDGEEKEDEEEGEEDLLEGVLSGDDDEDEDDTDNEYIENNEGNNAILNTTNKNKNENESYDDDKDDVLEGTIETSEKIKPLKVPIKKKPASDESEKEEEEEEDILDVLEDDDEEDSDDDDDDDDVDDDDDDDEKEKDENKKKATTQATTIKLKAPTTPKIIQIRKPVTTEKVIESMTSEDKVTEKFTENIFIYKEPVEKVTEKIIIYQKLDNQIPNKIFIYKEPENETLLNQKTTEKSIFYKEPAQQSVTEKFIIYNDPDEKVTEKPMVVLQNNIKSSEETKDNSDEQDKIMSADENSSEEILEDDNNSGKHTLIASIVKPGFSNKYAEEHDLTDSDDLDTEDSEDDGSDFEEDRKMEENRNKQIAKSSLNKKTEIQVSKPKIFNLRGLNGQHKKYYSHSKDSKPISTSRTHRRMNLDRFLQVK